MLSPGDPALGIKAAAGTLLVELIKGGPSWEDALEEFWEWCGDHLGEEETDELRELYDA